MKKNTDKDTINKIKSLNRNGKIHDALDLINEYLDLYSNDTYVKIFKAMILLKISIYNNSNNYEESKKILDEVLSDSYLKTGHKNFALTEYARILEAEKNYEIAIKLYYKVIEESLNLELYTRAYLSTLLANLKRFDEALDILKIEGFNNQFLNNARAYIYYSMKDYKNVFKSLDEETKDDTNTYMSETLNEEITERDKNLRLGLTYIKLKNYSLARKHLNLALKHKDKIMCSRVYLELAFIDYEEDKLDDCIYKLNELKNNISVRSNIYIKAKLLSSKVFLKKGDYNKALESVNDCDNLFVKKYVRGSILFYRYKLDEAKEMFEEIIEDDKNVCYEDALLKLNSIYCVLNDKENYERILNLIKSNQISANIKLTDLYYRVKNDLDLSYSKYDYYEIQIVDYSEDRTKGHLEKIRKIFPEESFNEEVNTKELINISKSLLNNSEKFCQGIFDVYRVSIPEEVLSKNKSFPKKVIVRCLVNTHKILLISPLKEYENDYSNENLKIKRKSQIDKFYSRYGKR